ncbi:MAG: YXWGXW repeat-containing protein [Polaromonas sp.]|nr:YXWGXW repeat-containing protein [Polaromonas sp.]
MKHTNMLRSMVLSLALAAGTSAFAQISFQIVVAPPAPLYEVAPIMQSGYIWAPGYWAWNHDRHIWVRGRTIVQRDGYIWAPDRWVRQGGSYVRQPGRWERSMNAKPVKMKKPKHDNGRRKHGNNGKSD